MKAIDNLQKKQEEDKKKYTELETQVFKLSDGSNSEVFLLKKQLQDEKINADRMKSEKNSLNELLIEEKKRSNY